MPTEVAIVSPGDTAHTSAAEVASPSPSPPPSPSSEEWTPVAVTQEEIKPFSIIKKNDQTKTRSSSVLEVLEDEEESVRSSYSSSTLDTSNSKSPSPSPLPPLLSPSLVKVCSPSKTPEPPLRVEDNSASLYWNASFLYHTGLALSPKIKTQNLRSSVSMSDMHRPRSPAVPKYLAKSPSNDSGTGTTTTVGSSEEQMSPLRRRHLSCSSSSSGSLGSLKKGTKVSSSMRLIKALGRPTSGLSSFMERTQSLGRYSGSKVKSSVSPLSSSQMEEEEQGGGSSSGMAGSGTTGGTTSSSSGPSTVKKALRDSFRAAKNLLPSSNKLKKEVVTSSSTLSLSEGTHTNDSSTGSTINQSDSPKATIRGLSGSLSGKIEPRKESKESTKSNLRSFLSRSRTNLAKSVECLDGESVGKEPADVTASNIGESSKGNKKAKELSKKEKKEAEKARQIQSGEEKSPKKVSLVKSLKNKIRSRSKDRKDKAMASAESKSSNETQKRSESQEILNFDNEPRVRTPKTVRHRYSSTPEKDRDLNEMEVRGEAIETTNGDQSVVDGSNVESVVRSIVESSQGPSKKDKGKKKGKDKKKAGGPMKATPANATSNKLPEMKLLDTKLDIEDEINESEISRDKAASQTAEVVDGSEIITPRVIKKTENESDEVLAVSSKSTNAQTQKEDGEELGNEVKEVNTSKVPEDAPAGDDEDEEPSCTESFRQLKPFNYDLEPIEEGKRERLYKVLVVGELGAGKTSIIKRYVHQFFSQHYRATIGVDFALKVLRWDPDTVVRLQLWDIAGQERFGSMTRVYYKEAVGAFVVFDVTRAGTLEAVPKWKADLDSKVALPDGRPIPTVLLANKSDQPKEGIAANREKMNDFCQQQGFSAWFETSAKDNINIDESANFLVSKILEMDRWSQEPVNQDPDKVDLSANGKHKPNSPSNCAC